MLVSKAAPRASSASGSAGVLLPTSKADAQTLARAAVAAAESASAAAHQVLGVLIYSTYSGHASFLFFCQVRRALLPPKAQPPRRLASPTRPPPATARAPIGAPIGARSGGQLGCHGGHALFMSATDVMH